MLTINGCLVFDIGGYCLRYRRVSNTINSQLNSSDPSSQLSTSSQWLSSGMQVPSEQPNSSLEHYNDNVFFVR